jgi:hypothetical protein
MLAKVLWLEVLPQSSGVPLAEGLPQQRSCNSAERSAQGIRPGWAASDSAVRLDHRTERHSMHHGCILATCSVHRRVCPRLQRAWEYLCATHPADRAPAAVVTGSSSVARPRTAVLTDDFGWSGDHWDTTIGFISGKITVLTEDVGWSGFEHRDRLADLTTTAQRRSQRVQLLVHCSCALTDILCLLQQCLPSG